MAQFNFQLQNFLAVKEKLEEQHKVEFGMAISELERQKQKKAVLVTEKQDTLYAFRKQAADKVRPTELAQYSGYVEVLKGRIEARQVKVDKADAFAARKRHELVESMKERKMLEKLKENAYESYLKDERRAEHRQVDEVVSYRYSSR